MSKKNEKQPQAENTALQTQGTTAMEVYDYGEDEAAGFEGQTREDMAIPFLRLLQTNSPEVNEAEPRYVEGARPGMFINTLSKKLYDGKVGVKIIAAKTEHVYVEWIPRDAGGGFVGVHQMGDPVVAQAKSSSTKFGKYKVNGNDLVETFYIMAVLEDEEGAMEQACIDFTSTKIAAYKNWNGLINSCTVKSGERKVKPPTFAHLGRLTSVPKKNEKGVFYTASLAPAVNSTVPDSMLSPKDHRYQAGKALYESLKAGALKVDYAAQEQGGGGGVTDEGVAPF